MQQNMPGAAAKALRFLSNYVKEHKIQGYYGPIINLFDCNERYYTAVEQAGGARMFNAVVDDELVASKLVEALMKSKEGRMQFLPLSKLRPDIPEFPKNAQNAQPLHKCIKYDHKVRIPVLRPPLCHELLPDAARGSLSLRSWRCLARRCCARTSSPPQATAHHTG